MTRQEEIQGSINGDHGIIQEIHFDLLDISGRVSFLHPKLADTLHAIAVELETARKAIQHGHSEMINLDLDEAQKSAGRIIGALLDKAQS